MEKNSLSVYNDNKSFVDAIKKRQNFSMFQANILAQCYGNLKKSDLKLLNYFLTFIKKSQVYDKNKVYITSFSEMFKTMGISSGGTNYEDFIKRLKFLKEKTNILIPFEMELNGKIINGYNLVSLFENFVFLNSEAEAEGSQKLSRQFAFSFNEKLAPFLYELKDGNFFVSTYKESEKSTSKHEEILRNLWRSFQYGNNKTTTITASLQEWRVWLLGSEKATDEKERKKWTAAKIKSNALKRGIEKLQEHQPVTVTIKKEMDGRRVIGFTLTFIEHSSKELLAKNEALQIQETINQRRLEESKTNDYVSLVMEWAIKTNQTPLAAADELKSNGEIPFIPPQLIPDGQQ